MSLLILVVVLAAVIPSLALIGHLYVAYVLAPGRAKSAILDALSDDQDFQTQLVDALLRNLLSARKNGDKEYLPVDLLINRAKTVFSEMASETGKKYDAGQLYPENPLLGAAISMLPKQYRGIALLIAQYASKSKFSSLSQNINNSNPFDH
jgi:hypothetical protein